MFLVEIQCHFYVRFVNFSEKDDKLGFSCKVCVSALIVCVTVFFFLISQSNNRLCCSIDWYYCYFAKEVLMVYRKCVVYGL